MATRIKQAAKRALDAGEVHTTANCWIPALRAAIADNRTQYDAPTSDAETEARVPVGTAEAILSCTARACARERRGAET